MKTSLSILRSALDAARAKKAAFWTQISIMVINDVCWVLFWHLFFRNTGSVRGWDVHDVMILFATITVVVGCGLGLFRNARRLGDIVSDGGLDAALTLPMSPLGYLLPKVVEPMSLGDVVFGFGLLFALCDPTPERLLMFVVGCSCGIAVFVSFMIIVNTVVFFTRGRNDHSDLIFDMLIMFGTYPVDLFGGFTKLILFTALPVGFMSALPATLVNDFDPISFAMLLAVAVGSLCAAHLFFRVGLRRYRSGSSWVRA